MEALTCPYCNAFVPAPVAPGPKMTCPRCGEAFPNPAGEQGSVLAGERGSGGAGEKGATTGFTSTPTGQTGWTNAQVVRVVLGGMAAMAAIGLSYALYTQPFRRSHDPRPLPPEPLPIIARTPADLPALRYLPPRCNVVAGIHVAELLQTPGRKEWLESLPGMRTANGRPVLEAWTGLKLDDIDHAVLAFQESQVVPPPALLVVHTRRPYDANQVRAALKGSEPTERAGKTLSVFPVENVPLTSSLWLWCPDKYTLVVGRRADDFQNVPAIPEAGAERLVGPVRTLLKERVARDAQVWLVGHFPELAKKMEPLVRPFVPPDSGWEVWTRVPTFSAWLHVRADVTLHAELECTDEKTAQALAERINRTEELPRELRRTLQATAKGTAVNVTATTETGTKQHSD